jgi:hypothetical protein
MKLIISELIARSSYVSREFAYIIRDLIGNYGWRHIETYDLLRDPRSLKNLLLDKYGELPETILFLEGYELLSAREKEINELDCHKCILCDDLHCWSLWMRREKIRAFSMCDTILSTYGYIFDHFYPELSNTKDIAWIPHSASPDFLLDYNGNPENAIFLSGAVSDHYPLRQQMKDLFTNGANRIVYHQHPGYHCHYNYENNANIGRAYAERINSYRGAFTDSSKYEYVVAKYFEILATGSLLVADSAVSSPLKELGLIEDVHYVPVSIEDLKDKIEYVLNENNHESLDEIRKKGQEEVWGKHKTSDRARLINNICTGVS